MTRKTLMAKINKAFPKMPLRLGENFSPENKGAIWTGEDAGEASDGNSVFNYYAFEIDPQEKVYVLGVHRELLNILNDAGWHAEFYDAGTVLIYNDN